MHQEHKTFIAIILGAFIIGGFVYLAMTQNNVAPRSKMSNATEWSSKKVATKCNASDKTMVTKVIDGDTVIVEGGAHIRLLGIDADEKGYPCYDGAKQRLENLVLNKEITLEKDTTDVDQYGRCLRTIFLQDKNIDLQLVKEGLVVARFYEPDIKHKEEIALAEAEAIKNNTGCKWKK